MTLFHFQGWEKKTLFLGMVLTLENGYCSISATASKCFVPSCLSQKRHVRVVSDMFVGVFTCELLFLHVAPLTASFAGAR